VVVAARHAFSRALGARAEGVIIGGKSGAIQRNFFAKLEDLDLHQYVRATAHNAGDGAINFFIRDDYARDWMANSDTTQLANTLKLDPANDPDDLEREILLSMLAGPRPFIFPNFEEFNAAVRIRCNIVGAARRTQLAFHTVEAERPADFWTYSEEGGFTILPGKPLIEALEKATQPKIYDKLYSFSCYRATEYVILLGIAQELQTVNPLLLERLQTQWETRAIMSGKFHDVFLYEYGSLNDPLPLRYYVPGDRVWFRNPDERSSNISGYEGSWVFYLGSGLFSNFWKRNQPYTFTSKCVEIFHWRNSTYLDATNELRMNETVVEKQVRDSLQDPEQLGEILRKMERFRDPHGVYAEGGCIDASREFARYVCTGTADIVLPGL